MIATAHPLKSEGKNLAQSAQRPRRRLFPACVLLPSLPKKAAATKRASGIRSAADYAACSVLCAKPNIARGFTQCSDCHLPLAGTKQEADQQTATPVWRGGNESEFAYVLTALQDAEIPLLFKERLDVRSAAQAALLNLFSRFASALSTTPNSKSRSWRVTRLEHARLYRKHRRKARTRMNSGAFA